MYSSDNNNLHDDKIPANQILELIESLGDDKLTAFFKQMDYNEQEKILYLYQQLMILPKYDKDGKLLPVSETDQVAAVNRNGYAIQYIKNPSEKVQVAAVNQNGFAIYNIIKKGINPSEDVQLAAVNQNVYAIEDIPNPSEKVKQLAREKGFKNV